MSVEFYGLKNCDSCRKDLKELREDGIEVAQMDVRADGVPGAVVKQALDDLGVQKVLNTRSTTWRTLSEAERKAPPLALLEKHPTLIKRPLIVAGGQTSTGWNAAIRSDIKTSLEA